MKVYLAVIAGLISGCMTYDPYTGEQQISKSTQGAVIGAGLGAIAGNNVKGDRRTRDKAMAGGVLLGAMAGGVIGQRVDKQEAALRQRLQSTGVSISRQGDRILLNMPGSITFDKGSSVVKSEFAEILNSIALVLKEYKQSKVDIAGHADSKGSIEVNQLVSQQRAN
jgi:outer membrane protein OmpA-like peptidoglycan-associated protein